MTLYTHRPWKVAAIQWLGDNFPEVQQFVRENIGPDDETGVRADADGLLQFYAWHDDQEVDPECWIVVHLGVDTPSGDVQYPDEFRARYEPTGASV